MRSAVSRRSTQLPTLQNDVHVYMHRIYPAKATPELRVLENNAILCKHSRLPETRIINFDVNGHYSYALHVG